MVCCFGSGAGRVGVRDASSLMSLLASLNKLANRNEQSDGPLPPLPRRAHQGESRAGGEGQG
jgi:hypothetical protein